MRSVDIIRNRNHIKVNYNNLPFGDDINNLIYSFDEEKRIFRMRYDNCLFMIELMKIKQKTDSIKPNKLKMCMGGCGIRVYDNYCNNCDIKRWFEIS